MTRSSVRAFALCALTPLVLTFFSAPPAGAAGGPRPAVATLSASPDTDLVDGQLITVTAAGYPAHSSLDLVQCVQDQGCDFSNLQVHDSGDEGGFTATFAVRRLMHLDDGLVVDCAVAQDCILVSLDISGAAAGAQTSITFDPDAPVPPPLRFRVAVDPTGRVRVDKGVARITGTVHCNQPVDITAFMELTQVYKQQIFRSEAFVDILCDRDNPFTVVFRPGNGLYGEGNAKVHIEAFGSTSSDYDVIKNTIVNLVPVTA